MTGKHTPEPWSADEGDGYIRSLAVPTASSRICQVIRNKVPTARRIVVCVNACAGLSTQNLEQEIRYLGDRFRVQQDAMLEALGGLMEIAEMAMPDTYFRTDSRVIAARTVTKEEERRQT